MRRFAILVLLNTSACTQDARERTSPGEGPVDQAVMDMHPLDAALGLDAEAPDQAFDAATVPDGRVSTDAAERPDGAFSDAGPDAQQPDAQQPDAQQPDAQQPDAAVPDVAVDAAPGACIPDCEAPNICAAGVCEAPFEVADAWATYAHGRVFSGFELRTDGTPPAVYPTTWMGDEALTPFVRELPPAINATHFIEASLDAPAQPDEITLRMSDAVIMRVPVVAQPQLGLGQRCIRYTGRTACAPGSMCLRDDSDCVYLSCYLAEGTCRAVEVRAYSASDFRNDLQIDVRGGPFDDEVMNVRGAFPGFLRAGTRERIVMQPVGRMGDGPLTVDHGQNLLAADVAIQEPSLGMLDAPCDPLEVADRCAAGLVCSAGICRPVAAPTVDRARLAIRGQDFGIWATGTDPNFDLESFEADGQLTTRLAARLRSAFPRFGATQTVQYTPDGQFEMFWSGASPNLPQGWGEGTFQLRDAVGRLGFAWLDREPGPLHPPVGVGEPCDVAGLVFPCEAGLHCDQRFGIDEFAVCHAPDQACPAFDVRDILLNEDLIVEADILRRPDEAGDVSCNTDLFAAPVYHYRFVAPEAGVYRFGINARGPASIGLRTACLLRHSEIACAHQGRDVDGFYPAHVDHELAMGETIFVAINMRPWFRVSVRRR